jgi:hypothetical protein
VAQLLSSPSPTEQDTSRVGRHDLAPANRPRQQRSIAMPDFGDLRSDSDATTRLALQDAQRRCSRCEPLRRAFVRRGASLTSPLH